MAGVTQWAEIESGADPLRRAAVGHDATAVRAASRTLRLRRSERLVIGSMDTGAHLLQRRARHLLLGSAVFLLPMAALQLLVSTVAWARFDDFQGLLGDSGYLGAERGAAVLTFVVQSLAAHLVGAYAAAYAVRYQLGGDPRPWPLVRAVLRRAPVLLATWTVSHSWLALGVLVYMDGDMEVITALAVVAAPVAVLFGALTLFVAPVVMVEGVRGALRRATRLVRGRFGAAYGFVWLNLLIGGVLTFSIAVLPAAAEGTGLVVLGDARGVLEGVAAQMALLIVAPFSAVATAQMYLQTRVHMEGLDITLAADAAFGGRR
jgi:hypothetical protein